MSMRESLFGKGAAKCAIEEAEALERAANAAEREGDHEHATGLRKAALIKRRVARERSAGVKGWPICYFDKV